MPFESCTLTNFEASQRFNDCFGDHGICEDELYYDPMNGIDKRQKIAKSWIQKAPSISSTTGGTYTGYGLMPPFVDPSIVDRTVRQTPLVSILPRRAVRGRSIVYNIITALAGAQFLGEDVSISPQVDTRTTGTATMSYLYAKGKLTGPAIASETIIGLLAEDIRAKTASLNYGLENEIINGNTATNAAGFQGLIQLITTNSTDNSGASITLELIRTDMNTCFEANGIVDLVVTDGSTYNTIKGLLMDYQRYVDTTGPGAEFGLLDKFYFDGAMFIKDRYCPTTAASRRIFYLDTRYIYLAVLQDYTYNELPQEADTFPYLIKWYGTFVMTFQASCAQRYGLA